MSRLHPASRAVGKCFHPMRTTCAYRFGSSRRDSRSLYSGLFEEECVYSRYRHSRCRSIMPACRLGPHRIL